MAFSKSLRVFVIIGMLTKYSDQACRTIGFEKYEEQKCTKYRFQSTCKNVITIVSFSIICQNDYVDTVQTTEAHSKIKKIEISNCSNSKISSGMFHDFENLVHLDVKKSDVDDMEPGAFNGASTLQDLSLTENKISKLSKGVFNSLTKLQTLNLSNNFVQEMENNAFLGMKNINSLSLSHNNLSDITELSNICDKVQTLDLSHNRIENLISFNDFKSLSVLILNNNRIGKLTNGFLVNTAISSLDLSSNLIRKIDKETFRNIKSLSRLNLALNEMSDLDEGRLPLELFRDTTLLQHLNLSGIGLNGVHVGTLTGLTRLKVLDISHNNIKHLSKSIFHDLASSLSELYINDNSFIYFEYGRFDKLSIINFNDNPWPCDTLSMMVQKISSESIVRGSSSNTTNIFGIACSEIRQENEISNTILTNRPEIEDLHTEKYNGIYLNATIEEYRDFLGEVKRDLEAFYKEFSESFLDIFKTSCVNSFDTNCGPKREEASEVNLKLTQSALERLNSDREVLEKMLKKFNDPQRLESKFIGNEEVHFDNTPNIVFIFMLLVLILILFLLIVTAYLVFKLLKDIKMMHLPLIENVNL